MKLLTAKQVWSGFVSLLFFSFTLSAHAALVGRDLDGNLATSEAYYDTVQNITWLADANFAQTSGYDSDGQMTWVDANAWAATLNFGGITGWRLPNTVDVGRDGGTYTSIYGSMDYYQGVDYGYNITTHSEMSHMFYEALGNLARCDTAGNCPQAGWGLNNTDPFSNLQPNNYWSATEYLPDNGHAWLFHFNSGFQGLNVGGKAISNYAWAVHTGDVGANVVPIPAAAWLFGSALLGLMGFKQRR